MLEDLLEGTADNIYVIAIVYFFVGIPLNVYLYTDVIDKRWRPVRKVCRHSHLYGIYAVCALLVLVLYTYLQFHSGDYKEGAAAVLTSTLAIYGLYLYWRQVRVINIFYKMKRKARSIEACYKNNGANTSWCELLFGREYESGPVKDEISSSILDDNYPGDGPRLKLVFKSSVKDWTEMMIRIGIWIRLTVIPARVRLGSALRPRLPVDGTKVDVSDLWTLWVVKKYFLDTEGKVQHHPESRKLDKLIECINGAPGVIVKWRETLRFAPESEWSQALSEFRSEWIEGLDLREVAWEVYLTFALHSDSLPSEAQTVESFRDRVSSCCTNCPCSMLESGNARVAMDTSAHEPSMDDNIKHVVETFVRDTMRDGDYDDITLFVTPSILMTAFGMNISSDDESPHDNTAWLKDLRKRGGTWHNLAKTMDEDGKEDEEEDGKVPEMLTRGVDFVVALAIFLDADRKSFEFPLESAGRSFNDVLKERRRCVLRTLQESVAKTVLTRALEQRLQLGNNNSPDVAESRYCLGNYFQAQRELEKALKEYDGALRIWKRLKKNERAWALSKIGQVLGHQAKYDKADELSKEAISLWENVANQGTPDQTTLKLHLAAMYDVQAELSEKQMKFVEADKFCEKSLSVRRDCYGEKMYRADANVLNSKARLRQKQSNYREAEALFEKAQKILQDDPGQDRQDLSRSLTNLAEMYSEWGKYAEAKGKYLEVKRISEKVHGPNHPQVAEVLGNLANISVELGHYDIAEIWYWRVLAVDKATLGDDDLHIARDYGWLAELYTEQGKYDEADKLYEDALTIRKRTPGDVRPEVAAEQSNLAGIFRLQGRYEEAEKYYIDALTSRGVESNVALELSNPSGLFRAQDEAEKLHEKALATRKKVLDGVDPKVADDLSNLAGLFRDQGEHDKAEKLYEDALTIRERTVPEVHPSVTAGLSNLARLCRDQGQYNIAELYYGEALRRRCVNPAMASKLSNLAEFFRAQGEYEKAKKSYEDEKSYRDALATSNVYGDVAPERSDIAELFRAKDEAKTLYDNASNNCEEELRDVHPKVAEDLSNLAGLFREQGEYDKAEAFYKDGLNIRKGTLGEFHPSVAADLSNLARLFRDQGKLVEAEKLYQEALDIREKALGDAHPEVAEDLSNLAGLFSAQGKYDEAESGYTRALEIRKTALGDEHPSVAVSLNNLARLCDSQGKYDEAEQFYKQALDVRKQTRGLDHPQTAISLDNLAGLFRKMGKYDHAELHYERALGIFKRALRPSHPQILTCQSNLAGLLKAKGKYDDAARLYKEAIDIRKNRNQDVHPNMAVDCTNLAILLDSQGKSMEDVGHWFKEALRINEEVFGPDHRKSLQSRAKLLASQGEFADADAMFEKVLRIDIDSFGEDHPTVADDLNNRAAMLYNQGMYSVADRLYCRVYAIHVKLHGVDHPEVATDLTNRAEMFRAQGDNNKAVSLLEKALDLRRQKLGENHADTIETINLLEDVRKILVSAQG